MMKIAEKTKTPLVRFEEFFSTEKYKDKVFKALENYPTLRSIEVDYRDLEIFDHDLADLLIDKPEAIIEAAQQAIKNIDPLRKDANLNIRFENITNIIPLRELRSKFIGKLVAVDGIVRKTDEIRPRIVKATFECRNCGRLYGVTQTGNLLREPPVCPDCSGRSFRLIQEESEFIDTQTLKLQEPLENLSGGEQPRQITVILEDDLVDILTPGDIVRVTGILKTIRDDRTKRFKNFIYGNYTEFLEQEFEEVEITPEDEKKIKELAADPNIYERIVRSTAPSIYGYREIKEAIALQLFGGSGKELDDKTRLRGDIHILIVGDPGIGKSQMLKYVSKLAPRGIYTSGKGTSGVGLCIGPESLIFTNENAIEIREFVDENFRDPIEYRRGIYVSQLKEPTLIQTVNPPKVSFKQSNRVWKIRSPRKLVRITTQTGKELISTPETKILTFKDGKFKWVKSKNLQGEYVVTAKKIKHEGKDLLTLELIKDLKDTIIHVSNPPIKLLKELREYTTQKVKTTPPHGTLSIDSTTLFKVARRAGYSIKELNQWVIGFSESKDSYIRLPRYLNREFSYFVGLVIGDGNISFTPDGDYSIQFSNRDKRLIAHFKNLIERLFGIKAKENLEDNTPNIIFNSRIIAHILFKLGMPKSKPDNLEISRELFSLPNDKFRAFLGGLFDTRGSITTRGVEFHSKSKILTRKLQLGLLRFGITSNIEKKEHDQYILRISGENIGRFAALIGFKDTTKKVKLQNLMDKWIKQETSADAIPNIKETISEIIRFYGINTQKLGIKPVKENISRRSLRNLIKKIKKGALIENIKIKLKNRLRSKICELLKPEELNLDKATFYNYFRGKKDMKIPVHVLMVAEKKLDNENIRKSISQILNELKEKEAKIKEKIGYLESLADSDILFEKIKKHEIIDSQYKYVYDLTVPGSNSFIANGIVIHNTAAAVRDEFGGWSLEAGALVLGDKGNVCVDELDKMREEDRSAIHEALEQQTISVAKAGIMATLNARCSVLAAANPKFGRFDSYRSIAEQIDLPPTILSRFDLIFVIEDKPNEERDRKLAKHILETHKEDALPLEIEPELLRKYIAYARKNIEPKLTNEATKVLEEFYVSMRSSASDEDSPVPITARQLEAIIRLAEASARVRLKKNVEAEDAKRAIRLAKSCLKQVGYDPETGKIDIDKVEGRTPKSERDKFNILIELIKELEEEYGGRAPINILKSEMMDRYNISGEKVEELLKVLQDKGVIFEPARGYVKIV